MSEQTADPAAVVTTVLDALDRTDIDTVAGLLDPDVVYQNVSLPTARGRSAALRILRPLERPELGLEVVTHRLAATGPVVITERTDVIVVGRVRIAFWVCGVFEVHDGRVTLWRDYFDWMNTSRGAVVGLARAAASVLTGRRERPAVPVAP